MPSKPMLLKRLQNLHVLKKILAALSEIPGLEEDDFLSAYDILISNDRKFRSLVVLPAKLKKKWIIKQIKT
jgi:hypothetical protein